MPESRALFKILNSICRDAAALNVCASLQGVGAALSGSPPQLQVLPVGLQQQDGLECTGKQAAGPYRLYRSLFSAETAHQHGCILHLGRLRKATLLVCPCACQAGQTHQHHGVVCHTVLEHADAHSC
jgi:hypothetical protein